MTWPVLAYLAAIAAANLLAARFGPGITVLNALLLIGLDLSLRDRLHDAWRGRQLVWRMGLLVAGGGLISYLINRDAGRIALASTVAFTAAAVTDALVYHSLRRRSFQVRANGSNVPAAAVDSVLFPTLAFGSFDPLITLGQFLAKTVGGAAWAFILDRGRRRVPADP
jgi:queuosine precursor transporter